MHYMATTTIQEPTAMCTIHIYLNTSTLGYIYAEMSPETTELQMTTRKIFYKLRHQDIFTSQFEYHSIFLFQSCTSERKKNDINSTTKIMTPGL